MNLLQSFIKGLLLINIVGCASATQPPSLPASESHDDKDRTLIRHKPPEAIVPQASQRSASSTITSNKGKHAILIGVGKYKPPFELEGPPHDVEDLEQALITHWSFSKDNIVKLVDKDASKKNILHEIEKLQTTSQPGDQIFIYFSGHGTSAKDEGFGGILKLPYSSGAIVPYDYSGSKSSLIIGRTDLKPLLSKLDDGNRNMLVVFDSCYSGNSVRSMLAPGGQPKAKARFMKLPVEDSDNTQEDIPAHSKSMARAEPYPYRNIVYLSAAQENETANDVPAGNRTFDGQAHGAFTDALLRILNKQAPADLNGDGVITFQEIYESSKDLVAKQHWQQTPMALPLNGGNSSSGSMPLPLFQSDNHAPAIASPVINSAPIQPLKVSLAKLPQDLKPNLANVNNLLFDETNPDIVISLENNGKLIAYTGAGDKITDDLPVRSSQEMAAWLQSRADFDKLVKLAKAKAKFAASLELGNGLAGSAVFEGQRFNFTLQTQRAAYLLLLTINAQNQINVLYPVKPEEMLARDASQATYFPGVAENELIEATPPFGSDQLLLLAFDAANGKPPEILGQLSGLEQLSADAPPLKSLQSVLESGQESFAASALSLITLSKSDAAKLARR